MAKTLGGAQRTVYTMRARSLRSSLLTWVAVAACARANPSTPPAEAPSPAAPLVEPARRLSCPEPSYDPALGPGTVTLQFVVDTLGLADTTHAVVVASTNHALNALAVQALAGCRFRPFLYRGRPGPGLTQMEFIFHHSTRASGSTGRAPEPPVRRRHLTRP
jgi:hypothetical protein